MVIRVPVHFSRHPLLVGQLLSSALQPNPEKIYSNRRGRWQRLQPLRQLPALSWKSTSPCKRRSDPQQPPQHGGESRQRWHLRTRPQPSPMPARLLLQPWPSCPAAAAAAPRPPMRWNGTIGSSLNAWRSSRRMGFSLHTGLAVSPSWQRHYSCPLVHGCREHLRPQRCLRRLH